LFANKNFPSAAGIVCSGFQEALIVRVKVILSLREWMLRWVGSILTRLVYMHPYCSSHIETHCKDGIHCFFTVSVHIHIIGRYHFDELELGGR
jgi:hypothetical protein